MTNENLKTRLQDVINKEPNTIRAFVAQEASEYDDIKVFFSNLLQYGCISGMVSSLIYYTDTHKFFDEYYDEIEQLREETEDSLGEPIKINGDLKNTLVWFAFEETAYRLAIELNII